MTDVTNLFKATVKTVRSRQKAQGLATGPDKSILGLAKHGSEFSTRAKDVVGNISKLKDFLLEHRKSYINACNLLSHSTNKMTDAERDQIDADVEVFMRTCSEAIKLLKSEAHVNKVLPQVREHRDIVVQLIDVYLRVVCKIYSEQRAIRVKQVVDRKRLSRIEPKIRRSKIETFESMVARTEPKQTTEETSDKRQQSTENKDEVKGTEKPKTSRVFFDEEAVDEELSPEEIQMFERENEQLYEDMNSMVDEVKQIEGKVVEIAQLQEIFAEKVLEQEKVVENISDVVVGTTENIKKGNEDIREAIKNNAGLRVWILFILIVFSFSLLFLDWYNP